MLKSQANAKNLILGDLNADFKTTNGQNLMDICNANNFTLHIKEPTRVTAQSKSCLDQIISNFPHLITNVTVDPPVSTNDHSTIGAEINFKMPVEKNYYRTIWQYSKGDYDGFKNALHNAQWDLCFESREPDKILDSFNTIFINIARTFIPNRVVLVRSCDKPWFTSELRSIRRKVIRLYHIAKSKMTDHHWNKYKILNKEYHSKLDYAEKEYGRKINESLRINANSKSWWRTINKLIGRSNDTTYPPILNPDTNEMITDSQEKANIFNNWFLSCNNLDTSNVYLPTPPTEPDIRLSNIKITEQEVYDQLQTINTAKACGCDGISAQMLNKAGDSIVKPLTKLLNICIETNKFPSMWKKANVIPIYKKDDKENVGNYRPVSILPSLSKIFERIIFKNMFNFIQDNNLLTKHQSGFKPNDSTVNQLAYLYHTFSEAMDKRKEIQVVFCDISKAFDRVWHEGLLFKLNKIGISGNLLNLIRNYLSGRKQRVIIKGQTSDWGSIDAGVPQGSILGPLLFLIFINDIVDNLTCKVKLFADDTLLYVVADDHKLSADLLNFNLNQIRLWSNQWLVTFNPKKTKLLNISSKANTRITDFPIYFDNTKIPEVQEHKHLGLYLNSRMKWSPHINHTISSVSKCINMLQKFKYVLDRKTLHTMYISYVRPKLEYGSILWDDCSEFDKARLENIQLQCARIISGAKRGTSHELIYRETSLQPLADRRKNCKLKFMYKIVHNTESCPSYLHDLLPKNDGNRYNLRNENQLSNLRTRTEKFRKSLLPDCIRLWNKVPTDIRHLPSLHSFKKAIDVQCKPELLLQGVNRKYNIIHAQIRMNCSNLRDHLYKLHVVDTPYCDFCANMVEDANHFFFQCPMYHTERLNLFRNLNSMEIKRDEVTLHDLLFGSERLSRVNNMKLVSLVELYIENTGRFYK